MTPTPRAVELAGAVRRALAELDGVLEARPAFDPRRSRATFRIAATDHVALLVLPRLARVLEREAPGTDVSFVPWRGEPTLDDVASGRVDVAVAVGDLPAGPGGFYRKNLFDDAFVCVVRRGHPSVKKRLTLKQFVELPHILVSPRGDREGVVDRALAARGLTRRVAVVVPHFLVAPLVVAQSDLIVTLSERVARPFAELLPLAFHRPPIEVPGGTWFALWHERTHQDAAHRWFREALAAALAA